MKANAKRNQGIIALLTEKKLSYELIAEKVGTNRNVVSGVAFRLRHPGRNRTGVGTGHQPPSYYPKKTAHVAL